jgi:hypothetical protein
LLKTIDNRLVKTLLLLHGATFAERYLDENAIWGSLDAKISGIKDEGFGWMFSDHLKTIILGDVQSADHRFVNDFTDRRPIIGGVALDKINSHERHEKVSFWTWDKLFCFAVPPGQDAQLRTEKRPEVRGLEQGLNRLAYRCIYTYTPKLDHEFLADNQKLRANQEVDFPQTNVDGGLLRKLATRGLGSAPPAWPGAPLRRHYPSRSLKRKRKTVGDVDD